MTHPELDASRLARWNRLRCGAVTPVDMTTAILAERPRVPFPMVNRLVDAASRSDHAAFLWLARQRIPAPVEQGLPRLASVPARAVVAAALTAPVVRAAGWRAVVAPAAAATLAGAAAHALKRLVDRPRPARVAVPARQHLGEVELQGSFPSSHAATAFAYAVALATRDQSMGGAALLAASLIATARVVASDHYPADVAAGVALGTGVGYITARRLG